MEIKKEITYNFLTKVCFVFFGIFLTSAILALATKILDTAGIWLGFIISTILALCGIYFIQKNKALRIISWSMLGTLFFAIIAYIGILIAFSNFVGEF